MIEIKINEICPKAGSNRSSFYRNFKNKEQAIVLYLQLHMIPVYLARQPFKNTKEIFMAMFHSINDMAEVVDLLYTNDLSNLFL
ncbi:MAG: hypothetical protein Q4B82_09355 [Alysiella sp.]|uniref:hypothetical protein n=1 Tax=Alysiella sp. TaxID=1872483 RepID=UPI0026DD7301|nr:hypothetical protein [Alysiella sp.]MDO4434766.1 hypothetical protein [Alysiella sp.]